MFISTHFSVAYTCACAYAYALLKPGFNRPIQERNQIPVNRWEPRTRIKALAHTDLTGGLVLWHRLIAAGHKQHFFVKGKRKRSAWEENSFNEQPHYVDM